MAGLSGSQGESCTGILVYIARTQSHSDLQYAWAEFASFAIRSGSLAIRLMWVSPSKTLLSTSFRFRIYKPLIAGQATKLLAHNTVEESQMPGGGGGLRVIEMVSLMN